MRKKDFDCVEMKRKAARKICEAIKGMTFEEEVDYWRKRNAEMHRWLDNVKKAKHRGRASSA